MDQKNPETASADSSCDKDIVSHLVESTTIDGDISNTSHEKNNEETSLIREKDCSDETENTNTGTNVDSDENKSDSPSQNIVDDNVDKQSSFEGQLTGTVVEGSNNAIEEKSCSVPEITDSHTSQDTLKCSMVPISTNDIVEISEENLNITPEKNTELDCNKPSSSNEESEKTNVSLDTISSKKIIETDTRYLQPTENDKRDTSLMEIDPDLQDKEESIEKNTSEPEKTEFIQISQDKTDDSQIEGQSMDAEDPFGGDNLAADTVETLASDNFQEDDINFRKLGDQADNLQDVVNAKDSTFKSPLNNRNEVSESHNHDNEIEFISEIPKEVTDDISNDSVENKVPDDSQTNEPTSTSRSESSKIDEKKNG